MRRYYPANVDLTAEPLSRVKEVELFKAYYADPEGDAGLAARDQIIESYLKLVVMLSLRSSRGLIPEDEAISAGNMAIMDVLRTKAFNPEFGSRFGTYMAHYIKRKVYDAMSRDKRISEFPALDLHDRGDSVCRLEASLFEQVLGADCYDNLVDNDAPFQETLTDEECSALRERVAEVMETLTKPQKVFLRHYFTDGITNLADIGELMGVSREMARKYKIVVFQRLKFALKGFKK